MIRVGNALRGAGRSLSPFAWLGLVMTALALAVALFGPFFAPYPPDEIFGTSFAESFASAPPRLGLRRS